MFDAHKSAKIHSVLLSTWSLLKIGEFALRRMKFDFLLFWRQATHFFFFKWIMKNGIDVPFLVFFGLLSFESFFFNINRCHFICSTNYGREMDSMRLVWLLREFVFISFLFQEVFDLLLFFRSNVIKFQKQMLRVKKTACWMKWFLYWPLFRSLIWLIVCAFHRFVGEWGFMCSNSMHLICMRLECIASIWHTFTVDWRLNKWSRIYHNRPMHSIGNERANGSVWKRRTITSFFLKFK